MATGGMGRQQINGDVGRDGAPEGGPGQVHQGPGQVQHVLSDDMLYKLSKKIAQLTKVIYSLNTKNDDLEFDMDALRGNYEEKLEKATAEYNKMSQMVHHFQHKLSQDPSKVGGPDELPEIVNGNKGAEVELKKDLKKARHQLKQYETKIKNIEEEHKQQLFKISGQDKSPRPEFGFKAQFELLQKQVEKERQEYKRRFDKLEMENDNLKTDKSMMKRDFDELNSEKDSLFLQLSASKAEMTIAEEKPPKKIEDDDELKDQLIQTIDKLTADNAALRSELDLVLKSQQESKLKDAKNIQQLQTQIEEQKYKYEEELVHVKCEKAAFEKSLNDSREYFESEINTLVDEKNTFQGNYDDMKKHYEEEVKHYQQLAGKREEELGILKSEVMKIKEDLIAQEPKHREAMEDKMERLRVSENEVRRLEGELAISQLAAQTAEGQAKTLGDQLAPEQVSAKEREGGRDKDLSQTREALAKIQRDMGQANEKFSCLDDKFKNVESERDCLKKKVKETDIKIAVLNKKQTEETTKDQHVKELESALEEALVEREQILEACEKEIEHERNIAIELEQKMMEDFEWKLREVEGGYKTKIKTLEESVEAKIGQTEREITRQKDSELTKMCIDARRDMEEKLKTERSNLKSALEASAKSEKDSALAQLTLVKDRETRMLQRTWEEEKTRLNKEIKRLQTQIEQEVAMQLSKSRAEFDQKLFENNRKHAQICEKYQEEFDKMKEEKEGMLNRLRAEHSDKTEEYETRLSNLMSGKVDTIFQMKEEVESEFGERMENLREIYRKEISQQQESYVKDLAKWKELEKLLNLKLVEKRQECDDNIAYYSQREAEYDIKVDELMTRLQEQTAAYMKLQVEFDNYEWWDEEVDGEAHGHSHSEDKKRSRESLANRSRPPTRPPTREDIMKSPITNIQELKADEEEEEEEDEYEYEEAEDDTKNVTGIVFEPPPKEFSTLPRALSPTHSEDTTQDPEIPPRRGERTGNPEDVRPTWQDDTQSTKRNSTSSGKSTKTAGKCSQQ
eukprot:GFUD01013878.1.p1 GENE.GFUD01013878.1~~GFUD01013878.1.p1  ORF type:complete len:1023 (+),score=360.95 GFUD01013878.1:130-3198(+)